MKSHVLSEKHELSLQALKTSKRDDTELKSFLEDYYKENTWEEQMSVTWDTQVFRYRVVESMLANGIALAKADGLRNVFERTGISMTDSAHLRPIVPKYGSMKLPCLLKKLRGNSSTSYLTAQLG